MTTREFKFRTETVEGAYYVTRKMLAVTLNRDIRDLAQLDQTIADLRKLASFLEDQRAPFEKALQEER